MGKRMPETCWAVFERRAIILRDWCIWLVDLFESMMMHGLINSKFNSATCFGFSYNQPWSCTVISKFNTLLLLFQALQLHSSNVLAFSTYNFHLLRSWVQLEQFFIFSFFISFIILSSHLFCGLPSGNSIHNMCKLKALYEISDCCMTHQNPIVCIQVSQLFGRPDDMYCNCKSYKVKNVRLSLKN
jgi:hypothetical protein